MTAVEGSWMIVMMSTSTPFGASLVVKVNWILGICEVHYANSQRVCPPHGPHLTAADGGASQRLGAQALASQESSHGI